MKSSDKNQDILDILLDQDNKDPITMFLSNGKEIHFEQVAVIPYRVKEQMTLFAVLKPIEELEGIEEDEAMVFRVETDDTGENVLILEEDEMIAIEVFNKYYDLLEDAHRKKKKPNN
ncbi:MAG: DUF1292 domain-containing protein [Clostridia bacterium]|nr:DUF1292 domain-containing protein [Clostridia bacterium]